MNHQQSQSNDPLHGVTLKVILETMVARHGWERLANRIEIRCFMFDPSINSSLKFLRQTPWAREKLEKWYVGDLGGNQNAGSSESPEG